MRVSENKNPKTKDQNQLMVKRKTMKIQNHKKAEEVLNILYGAGLRPGINWRRELTELINDISMRDGISQLEVLQSRELREILEHKKLSGPQKLSRIKDILEEKRYPRYSKAKATFDRQLKELKLSSKLKVKHTPYFEDTRLETEYSDDEKDSGEIKASLKKLEGAELVKNALESAEGHS